jgi:hypothetical protein
MRGYAALALCVVACSSGTPTSPPRLELPVAVQARWPGCTLAGWTLTGMAEPFTPPPGTWCGVTVCTGPVRGLTNTRTRQITVWQSDPHVAQVLAWEGCNACRWEITGQLMDRGCA